MKLHVRATTGRSRGNVFPLRCPCCSKLGTFEPLGDDFQFLDPDLGPLEVGHRMCPNPSCHAHLFVVVRANRLIITYPPERMDFDSSDIPTEIVESLEEAITCHANQCFIAAAIMVRKTLELICLAQNATAGNLKEKIKTLRSKVVLPSDLLDGLDDLRLLGNDAAHVESETYAKVSQAEVEVAIEFTREVLKAIYQYSALRARLLALKKLPIDGVEPEAKAASLS